MTAKQLIAEILNCDPQTLDNHSGLNKHPEWDSFSHVTVLLTLEREFDITIDDYNIQKYATFDAIESLFEARKNKLMNETKVSFPSYDGVTLFGTLTTPIDETLACVLLVHGITSNREEWGFYKKLALRLLEANIASLRFDYRSHGESDFPSSDITLSGIVGDIDAAALFLRSSVTNLKKFYVVGTSFGGGLSLAWNLQSIHELDGTFLCAPVLDYHNDLVCNIENSEPNERGVNLVRYAGELDLNAAILEEAKTYKPDHYTQKPLPPTTIFHGIDDNDVPISSSRNFAEDVKSVRLIEIQGAGHGFAIQGDNDLTRPGTLEKHETVYQEIIADILKK